jgi:hypothetical protein
MLTWVPLRLQPLSCSKLPSKLPCSKLAPARRLWSSGDGVRGGGGGFGGGWVGGSGVGRRGENLGVEKGWENIYICGQGGWDFRSSGKRPQRAIRNWCIGGCWFTPAGRKGSHSGRQGDVGRVRRSRNSGFSACQVLWKIAGRPSSRAAVCNASSVMCATQETFGYLVNGVG